VASDQGGHQQPSLEAHSNRDAFSAGRDMTVNNYFGGFQRGPAETPAVGKEGDPRPDRDRVPAGTAGLPWDFVVLGIPKSIQAGRASRQRWQDVVRTAATAAWPDGNPPLDIEVQIHVTFYHDSAPLDVDKLLKPIQDALCGVAYHDDKQLTDTHGHLRDLNASYRVRGMTLAQAHGFSSGGPFVHVRIEMPPSSEELP
jgi:crossover junction endodeoxyribonuclease RusA